MSEAHVEIDPEVVEQLRASKKLIGPLEKVVLNAQGERVDGDHRKVADPDWPEEVNENLKTERDCILYKIAKNWFRTNKTENWKRTQIEGLAKLGDDIRKIIEETGFKERTVYYYYPTELKSQTMAALGVKGGPAAAIAHRESQEAIAVADLATSSESQETSPAEELMQKAKLATEILECPNCHMGIQKNKMKLIDGELYCLACAPSVHVAKKNAAKTERTWKEKPEFRVAAMHPSVSKMDEGELVRLQGSSELRELGWTVEFQKAYYIMICRSDASLVRERNGKREELMLFWDGEEAHKSPEEDEAARERAKDELLANDVHADYFARTYKAYSPSEEQRLYDELLAFVREFEKWKEPSGKAEEV